MTTPGLRVLLVATALLAPLFGLSETAEAAVVCSMQPSGSDVTVNCSGTLDLADLQSAGSGPSGLTMSPFNGLLATGTGPFDFYSGVNGPDNFGTTRFDPATGSGGDSIYVSGAALTIGVPSGYVSGSPLSGNVTFANQTLVSLGVTDGDYAWTWGAGSDADSLTLSIGGGLGATAVPEPASALLVGFGLFGCGFIALRRRRLASTVAG
jgi:hypothetical protein